MLFSQFDVGRTRYSVGFLSLEPKPTPFNASDRSFVETIGSLCAARLNLRAQFERLRYQTEHDALTSIANRSSFRAQGFAAMRTSKAVGLLVLNLDNFRHTNDTLGQQTGDALLVEVAARLDAASTEYETVGRLGGDTFGMLLTNCSGRAEAESSARRFLNAFQYPFGTGDREDRERVSLGASVGIAVAPGDGDEFELLLARADTACYAAKDADRGQYAFFDAAIEETFAAARLLKNDIIAALTRNEFVLYFQPHVDLATRPHRRRRSADPLAAPRTRPHRTGSVHSVCRAARISRCNRRLGDGGDRPHLTLVATRKSGISRLVQPIGCGTP